MANSENPSKNATAEFTLVTMIRFFHKDLLKVRFNSICPEEPPMFFLSRQRGVLLSFLFTVALANMACSSVPGVASLRSPETLFGLIKPYRTEVVQGNVVTKEEMIKIQPGMTKTQVQEVISAPVLINIFHNNRWDYIFTIAKQGIAAQQRRVSLFFNGDVLERVEADTLPTEREFVASIERGSQSGVSSYPDLSSAQLSALPVPAKNLAIRKVPEGAVRDYPPLEALAP